jgi:DNA helicase-2/ATP-dependent DNA helicase PcrA
MPKFTPTPEQEAILAHEYNQNARILAGPGTGKSAILVELLNQLLTERPSSRVRLLTFTRAATAELAKKVSEHPAAATQRPSTIHSFAISILLRNPGAGDFPQPLRIADDWEDEKIVTPTLAKRVKVPVRKLKRLVQEMAANWESLCPEKDPRVDSAERSRFLGAWNEHRQVYGYTLLAELPYALRNALRDHPDLAGVDFELLVVDEYQDLNACDLEVLKLLGQRGCSIIAAGDDDQSIYSFRKAAPEGIRRFLSDYPRAADYALSVTQRCGSRIMEWATYVIEGDPDRPRTRRRLKSAEGSPPGDVALLSFAGEIAEAKGIAMLIDKIRRAGIPPPEILVLLRGDHNGSFSRPIKEQLQKLDIPYSDPDAVKRLMGQRGNRQMLEVFRLLVNREDSLAWASLLLLTTGIGNAFCEYIFERARRGRTQFGAALLGAYEQAFLGGPSVTSKRAKTLIGSVLAWLDAHSLPSNENLRWGQWIVETAGDNIAPAPSEDLKKLLLALDDLIEPGQDFGRYLGQIGPLGKDLAQAESEGVRIMTMAGAKGLTVRAAILAALEEGVVPRPDCDLGEERRLLYVAMTRAKEFVYGTWARYRRGPTARAGVPRVRELRRHSSFLEGGPIESQDGQEFIKRRWR